MSGFVASAAVNTLPWDFTAFAGPDAQGVIPEPTMEQLEQYSAYSFQAAQVVTSAEFREKVQADPDAMKAAFHDENQRILDELATLCSNSPNRDQLAALPGRVLRAFVSWVTAEVLSPTGGIPATKN